MTTPKVRGDELSTDDLEDWGTLEPPLAEALGDPMPDWQREPCLSRWDLEEGELIHVISGQMTCRHDDGSEVELSAGSTAVFSTGWAETWEIHETLRKVYVLFP